MSGGTPPKIVAPVRLLHREIAAPSLGAVARFAAILFGSLAVHTVLVWGLVVADQARRLEAPQEISVEVVTGIPGEKGGNGKGTDAGNDTAGSQAARSGDKPNAEISEKPKSSDEMKPAESADKSAPQPDKKASPKPEPQKPEAQNEAPRQAARSDQPQGQAQNKPAAPATPAAAPAQAPQQQAKAPAPVSLPFFLFPNGSRVGSVSRAPGAAEEKTANYKLKVFGMLEAEKGPLEDAARARSAKGGVVVEFSVDEEGRIVDLAVRRSSGNAEMDAEALALVRRAAPFPAPPPGAERRFGPMIAFGDT